MNIVIIGYGAIGQERGDALNKLGFNPIIVDPAHSPYSIEEALSYNPEWVFICLPHNLVMGYIEECEGVKNFLIEKPCGRTIAECEGIKNRVVYGGKINVGFNYRFYKGIRALLQDVKDNWFGDLISVNMILALGDGPGTEKTWRLDPLQAGFGAMLDPGCHLIDLAMLISEGTLEPQKNLNVSKFWNTGFQEEVHCLATDKNNVIYNIQASKVRWRNTFRIEVNGTDGYGVVEGRNRNYGPQTYRRGRRWGWKSGKSQRESEELIVSYDGEDSFFEETKAVIRGSEEAATHQDMERILKFLA